MGEFIPCKLCISNSNVMPKNEECENCAVKTNKKLRSELAACKSERDALKNQAEMWMTSYHDMADERDRFVIDATAAIAEIELLRGTIFELQAMVGERADLLMTDADFYEAVKEILKQ